MLVEPLSHFVVCVYLNAKLRKSLNHVEYFKLLPCSLNFFDFISPFNLSRNVLERLRACLEHNKNRVLLASVKHRASRVVRRDRTISLRDWQSLLSQD